MQPLYTICSVTKVAPPKSVQTKNENFSTRISIFTSYQEAENEASRLARLNPHRLFYVMKSVFFIESEDIPVKITHI